MEFRFAATQLHLPLIIVVVGTGNTWESTEVQLPTLSCGSLLTGSWQVHNSRFFQLISSSAFLLTALFCCCRDCKQRILTVYILQSSVAPCLRCAKIFVDENMVPAFFWLTVCICTHW